MKFEDAPKQAPMRPRAKGLWPEATERTYFSRSKFNRSRICKHGKPRKAR